MLQKAKSTLLKLLICVCVICCMVGVLFTATACNKEEQRTIVSIVINANGDLEITWSDGVVETIPFAANQPGEPGQSGQPGPSGVGIDRVEYKDGQLIVWLTNGESYTVDIPVLNGKCTGTESGEHNIAEVHKIADANCITGELWFVACMDCDANAVRELGAVNPDNHLHLDDAQTIKTTCTQDGHIIVKCLDCGEVVTDEVEEAYGHQGPTEEDGAVWTVVLDEGTNLCEHGGTKLLVCERCLINGDEISDENGNLYRKVVAAKAGHDIGDGTGWSITTEPTATTGGILSGPCHTEAGCGSANAEIELPPLSDARWTSDNSGNCSETSDKLAVRTWTIEVQGVKFSFKSTSPLLHYFEATGESYTGALDDPNAIYEWHEALSTFDNSDFDCSTVGYAHFKCSNCGEDILIRILGQHKKGALIEDECKPASCEEDGENVYACDANPEHRVREKVPATGHAYAFKEVTGEAPDLTIVEECANCGARKETKATSVTKNDEESEDATCDAPGKVVYDYTYTDAEGKEQTGKFESTVAQLKHRIADFVLDKGVTPTDGSIVYEMDDMSKEAKDLLKGFDNVPVSCTEVGGMHVICDGCKRDLLIFVRGEHDWNEGTKTDATCTAAGTITYTCKNDADHTKTEEDKEAPALGHSYKAELSADKKSVHLECERCGDKQDVELDLNAEGTNGTGILHKDADCSNEGYDRYYYIDPATKASKYVESKIDKVAEHTLKSTVAGLADLRVDAKNSKEYTIGEFISRDSSVHFFDNTPGDCTEAGALYIHCSVCDKDILIMNVKGDHVWDKTAEGADENGWVTTPASCGVAGSKSRTCSVCGKVETVAGEAALAHEWVETERVAPTLESAGKIVRKCTKCLEEQVVELPALNETDYNKTVVKAASCTSEGVDQYTLKSDSTLSFTASSPKTEHKLGTTIVWIEGNIEYTGHYCSVCHQTIVESSRELADDEIPEGVIPVEPEVPGDDDDHGKEEPEEPEQPEEPAEPEVVLELTKDSLFPGLSGTSYGTYNGTHQVGNYEITTSDVLGNKYGGKDVLQFKATSGSLTFRGEFKKIVIQWASTYAWDNANKFQVKVGETVLELNLVNTESTGIMITSGSNQYEMFIYTVELVIPAEVVGVQDIAITSSTAGAKYLLKIEFYA